jgi:hypothetical protein
MLTPKQYTGSFENHLFDVTNKRNPFTSFSWQPPFFNCPRSFADKDVIQIEIRQQVQYLISMMQVKILTD